MTADLEPARAELLEHWNIALAAFLAALLGSLPSYSLAVMVQPMSVSLGRSEATIALWTLFWSAGSILVAPFVGGLVDRLGARAVLMGSLPIFGVVLLAVGLAPPSTILLLGGAALIGAATIGLMGLACGRLLASFFKRQLGISLGIMSTGIGASAIGGPVVMQRLVDATSWQTGYVAIGLAGLAAFPLMWILTRSARSVAAREIEPKHANIALGTVLASSTFWYLAIGTLGIGLLMTGISFSVILYLTEIGLSRAEAASVAALSGLFTVAARLGTGWLLDAVRTHIAWFFIAISSGLVLCFLLLGLGNPLLAVLTFCVIGLFVGAQTNCLAFGTLKLFGRDWYGRVYGLIGVGMFYIGVGVGPWVFARLAEFMGGYAPVYFAWSALAIVVSLILLPLRLKRYVTTEVD